jgi:iron complex outermembrane receptor protein
MKHLTAILFAGLILGVSGLSAGYAQVSSYIVDAHSGDPVIHAHVYWKSQLDEHKGAATNLRGQFSLPPVPVGGDTLIVHALGYQGLGIPITSPKKAIPEPITLWPGVYQMEEEILVEATSATLVASSTHYQQQFDGAKRLHNQQTGAHLVKRGPHAAELSIRGMNSERLITRIDDVPVFSACVDKMDPVTSYVNPASMGSLKRTEDPLGTPDEMNIRMHKIDYSRGWWADLQSHYVTGSQQSKVNGMVGYGADDWSWSTDIYWMQAGNMVAGGGEEIANSAQHQFNGRTQIQYKHSDHQWKVDGTYNHSWDVGYPALLMDATKALSYLGSVEHIFQPRGGIVDEMKTKGYFSRVEHTMDDYSRDVTQREVMRNMYMPMAGSTETLGLLHRWSGSGARQAWSAELEWYQLNAFGDMRMESIFDDVPDMYLVNLGEIRQQNGNAGLEWNTQWTDQDLLSVSGTLNWVQNQVRDDGTKRYFRSLFGEGSDQKMMWGGYAKVEYSHTFEHDWKVGSSISTRQRIPSYKELFGYYIYNYEDGFFHNGNPKLTQERHYTWDVLISMERSKLSMQLVPYLNYVRNWIDGVFDTDFVGHTGVYQFKSYRNTGDVLLAGADVRLQWKPLKHWRLSSTTQYSYGHHLDWDEPLRMIPPLNGSYTLAYNREQWRVEFNADWAKNQQRIATTNAVEDRTPGYHVIGIAGSVRIQDTVHLSAQVNNLLDEYYWTHTSIGNIPSPGRTVQLSLRWKW